MHVCMYLSRSASATEPIAHVKEGEIMVGGRSWIQILAGLAASIDGNQMGTNCAAQIYFLCF